MLDVRGYLSFAAMLAVLMPQLLLVWFRKIPFTCSYFPGKSSLAITALVYIVTLTTYSWSMSSLEQKLLAAPWGLALFYTLGFLLLLGLHFLEKRELTIDSVLIYEDQPEPVIRSLELG